MIESLQQDCSRLHDRQDLILQLFGRLINNKYTISRQHASSAGDNKKGETSPHSPKRGETHVDVKWKAMLDAHNSLQASFYPHSHSHSHSHPLSSARSHSKSNHLSSSHPSSHSVSHSSSKSSSKSSSISLSKSNSNANVNSNLNPTVNLPSYSHILSSGMSQTLSKYQTQLSSSNPSPSLQFSVNTGPSSNWNKVHELNLIK